MYPQGEFRMPNRCGHLLIILSLAWLEATEAAGRIPMLKLTKARGYARVVQQDIQLEAGRVYQFTCAIRGSFRAGQGDHVPEFRLPPSINPMLPVLGPNPSRVNRPRPSAKNSAIGGIALAMPTMAFAPC